MNNTAKIARHEFVVTTGNKTFAAMTVIGPFLILAMAVLPQILSRTAAGIEAGTVISVTGADSALIAELGRAIGTEKLTLREERSVDEALDRLKTGNVKGALVLPDDILQAASGRYYSKTGTDYMIAGTLEEALGRIVVSGRLSEEGLDPARIESLTRRPNLEVQKVGEDGESSGQDIAGIMMTTIGFVLILYMTLIFYGQMIGQSVLIEKTSKTVEILLSSARPMEIMFGKILGKGLAGILQYGIWTVTAILLTQLIGPRFGLAVPAALSTANILYLFLFFILAFFLYAAGYAAIGSAAENEQNLGQLSWPLLVFLIIPIMMISGIVMNPDSTIALVLSFIPFTAPVIMLARILVGTPPAWQIVLSIGVIAVSIVVMIWISSRIFRIGILMTGKRFSFLTLLKWIRF